jgi:fatty-acyl-CoA synthase
VILDALPKNPSGKIVKRTLRDEHADLATSGAAPAD